MRFYKKKTDRGKIPAELYLKAADAVIKDGRKLRAVAREFNMCNATLHRFVRDLRAGKTPKIGYKSRTLFNKQQEKILVDYLAKNEQASSGFFADEIKKLAYIFAQKFNIRAIPVSWHLKDKAGVDWFIGFIKRNPTIVIKPTNESKGKDNRESLLSEERLEEFFTNLGEMAIEESYDPASPQTMQSESQGSSLQLHLELDNSEDEEPREIKLEVSGEESLDMELLDGDIISIPQDPISVCASSEKTAKVNFSQLKQLAEFQADEEEEFGAVLRSRATQSVSTPAQESSRPAIRVAASAPPPLPPSAHPMMWPEQPTPKLRPGHNADECQIFGDFVASELRMLRSDESRKRLKRMIQKAILQIGEEEDDNVVHRNMSHS